MRRRLSSFALATALMGFAGCAAPPTEKRIALQIEPSQQQAPADPKVAAPATNAPTTPAPTPADSASMLARKAEAYAKSMETAVAHRPPAKPQPAQDSLVQFLDPHEFRIGANEDAGNTAVAPGTAQKLPEPVAPGVPTDKDVKPGVQVAMTQANKGAAVDLGARADGSNSPATIPAEPNADKAAAMFQGAVETIESRVTKRMKEYPRDVSASLDYQLMLFLRDEPVPQLSSLTSLPTEDRELVSAVMDGLANFRSTLRSDNNMLYSRKIRPLTDLTDRLKQQAELSIPMLVLCTKVDGFGRYDPIEPARFPAQHEAQAIIYCELENFASQQNASKMYQTDVTQEAVLYTEDGMQVWSDKTQTIQDLSRHRRHDFFLRTLVKFPGTLTVGRYMLKVSIVDRQANRVAEASLPIQIVAQ